MSGGEIDGTLKEAWLALRSKIMAEADVHRLLALAPANPADLGGLWYYLIETPFATFPRFVVGHTDLANEDPVPVFTSGAEWSAVEHFQALGLP